MRLTSPCGVSKGTGEMYECDFVFEAGDVGDDICMRLFLFFAPPFFPLAFSTVSDSLLLIVPCIVIVKEVLA